MGKLFKRGDRWGVSYIDPNGKQIRKIVEPYKEAAERILCKIQTEIAEERYLDKHKEPPKILFEDFAKNYTDAYIKLQNKAYDGQSGKVTRIVRYFKGLYLQKITQLDIRRFMADRSKMVKPSTINRDVAMLKSMYNRAREWGVTQVNPVVGIKRLPENNERCIWLTEQEQERLLTHCHGIMRTLVIVALRTGMRWGEIVHLKWHQAPESNYVDFEREIIFIHESLTKSGKSRWVPLGQVVKWELLNVPKQEDTDYIFLNSRTKKPLGSIKNAFNRAVEKSGIKDFTFHSLRHTFASQLVRDGVDLYVVQKLLGHASPKMTQRYAHLREDMLKDAIKKIDRQFEGVLYNTALENSTLLAHHDSQGDRQSEIVSLSQVTSIS